MDSLQILSLEDNGNDAHLVASALQRGGLLAQITVAPGQAAYCAALDRQRFDVILSDGSVPGFTPLAALHQAAQTHAGIPFICLTGAEDQATARSLLAAGAADYLLKSDLERLPEAIRSALARSLPAAPLATRTPALVLATAVQALSLARDVVTVRCIVQRAARELTGADGATFVLRDGDLCHYVDEDAISPLWKGQKFPLSACISGWTMLNRQPAAITDIYSDARTPADAYRPTFVKSLVMVPIRSAAPIGSIGNYWASPHEASAEEIELLQALANTTAVALENIQVYQELERRVHDRTAQLQAANQELEAFSYSVSHDLRAPLRAIRGYTQILQQQSSDEWSESNRQFFQRIVREADVMGSLIENLLRLSQVSRQELHRQNLALSPLVLRIWGSIAQADPARKIDFVVAPNLTANADPGLLTVALTNLLANAWKYTGRVSHLPRVEFGAVPQPDGSLAFFVRDNGAGFNPAYTHRLFTPFHRLHPQSEFPGTGVGLATVQRIVHRHGGRIWAQAEVDRGATFFFTLPEKST